jgi:hypothetical protein
MCVLPAAVVMKTASLIGLFVIVLPVSLWAVDGWKTARLQV